VRGAQLLRRTIILVAGGVAASCASQPGSAVLATQIPPSTPPPTKITRLLLWLPADDRALDASLFAVRFTAALAPVGGVVAVGRARPAEADRWADQRRFITAFKPTHRLEIDATQTGSTRPIELTPSTTGLIFTLRAVLYAGDGREPLRVFEYGPVRGSTAKTGPGFVDDVVETLRSDDFL
jgi:hypothetical protein